MAKGKKPGGSGGGGSNTVPAPTGLTATVTLNGVFIQWNGVTNATSYWIYRNNQVIAIIQNLNYTDGYTNPGTAYTYAVAAVVNSVLGTKSNSVTVNI